MLLRCFFVSFLGLASSCAAPQTQAFQAQAGPPPNRAAPLLPRSDQGLDATWFIGAWRVQDSLCTLRLDRDGASLLEGQVHSDQCDAPWSEIVRWRRPNDGRALLDLINAEGRILWRAGAIQPTAIAGWSGDGELVRLYWAEDGPHPGWVQP